MRKHGTRRRRRQGLGFARAGNRPVEMGSAVEPLEPRQLLSGTPPVAADDAYTGLENQPLVVAAGTTSFSLNGHNGSYVYPGTRTWTPADGTFKAFQPYSRTNDNAVEVSFATGTAAGSEYWTLEFAAPAGQVLTAGATYTNATRFPFEAGTSPGIDVSGDGRGNNTETGQFTVLQATFNGDGSIANFAATFQQLDEGMASRTLDGTVYYNYAPAGSPWGVLTNDVDAGGNPLTARVVQQPAHGAVAVAANGAFTYTPAANFNGTDAFTYVANDGTSDSNVATATVTVLPVNQAPAFVAGANQAVNQDAGPRAVPGWATGITPGPVNEANQRVSFAVTADSDPALFATAPAVGPDGTLTYAPAAGVFGTAAVTVVAKDDGGTANGGHDTSAPQTFTVTVARVNHAPVAAADAFSTPADTPLVVAPATPVSSLYFNGNSYIYVGTHTWAATDGTFAASATGSGYVNVTFRGNNFPNSDWWSLDFAAPSGQPLVPGTYRVNAATPGSSATSPWFDVSGDGCGSDTVTGSFTVLQYARNSDGSVKSFAATFEQFSDGSTQPLDGTIDFNYVAPAGVLANDTDADGDILTASVVTGPQHGTLSMNSDGSFTYTPAAGYHGLDSFTYLASDGQLSSVPTTVSLQVTPLPVPVALAGGPYAVNEGGTVALSALGSTDPSGTIAAYAWDLNYDGTAFTADATGPTATFSAAALDGPTTRTVAVRVTDTDGLSSVATAVVTVADVPPTGTFAVGPAVQLGSPATVGFTNVTDPAAADTAAGFAYSFDLNNDGTFDVVNSTSPTVTVPASDLATAGPHTVRGRVADKDGGYTDYAAVVTVTPSPTVTVALSSLTPTTATTGYGLVMKDKSVGGNTLSLGGVKYASGMGVHAVSKLTYNLAGQYATFTSDVGVDDEENGKGTGSVDFQVFGDGRVLFDSGVLHNGTAVKAVHLAVGVTGVTTLTLVATNGVSGSIDYDHSDWAGATLTGSAPVVPGVPTGLTATALSATSVTLAWTAPGANVATYAVDRSTDGTTWATVSSTIAGSATTWTDPTTLTAGTTYDYRIRAANAAGASANSAVATVTTPARQAVTYLSDLSWATATAGYGTVQKDKSIGGNPLTLAGTTYAKGIGTHAVSTITYNLAGGYSAFTAVVGVDAEEDAKGTGHVDFQVVGDGKVLFDSGVLSNDQVRPVNVGVAGVKTLQLVATNGVAGSIDYDHADWAAAALTPATPTPTPTLLTGTVIGTAGSYQNKGNTAAKAFDGSLSTYFDGPTANGSWVGLDLGTAKRVSQIRFAPRAGYASRMVGGVFQASTTADFSSGVTTLYTVTAAPAQGQLTTVTLASPVTARYVRYLGPAGSYSDVAEVQFLG